MVKKRGRVNSPLSYILLGNLKENISLSAFIRVSQTIMNSLVITIILTRKNMNSRTKIFIIFVTLEMKN